ncbi:unnamed protein product [Brassica oleracea]
MAKLDSADSDLDRSMVSGCINKVRVWKASLGFAMVWWPVGGAWRARSSACKRIPKLKCRL